jgi:hypothetical protein
MAASEVEIKHVREILQRALRELEELGRPQQGKWLVSTNVADFSLTAA